MDPQYQFATRDEFWRLQEDLKDIYNTQIAQAERIMRLEKRREDDARVKSVWNGPLSPFPGPMSGSAQQEQGYNPAAEAFRSFDADPAMGHLNLDNEDDRRRGTSRANSVRFDESAMNHYGSSRQSVDLPMRTGSGLGSHPLSERSLSHRSDGKGSTSGLSARANSFVMDSGRPGGSFSGSPRVSANPPPGFIFLGPVPSIIRCWITENFSNDSLLYAAVCTGSYVSSVSEDLLQKLDLQDQSFEENGSRKIKLPIYLTEATIQQSSSRSGSPAPQVPTLQVKLHVMPADDDDDRAIKVFLGSDILRSHNADILFSQDRLLIFDEDRNKVAVPLVRPESETVYKSLVTKSIAPSSQNLAKAGSTPLPVQSEDANDHGIIQRPSRLSIQETPQSSSNIVASPAVMNSSSNSEQDDRRTDQASDTSARGSLDLNRARNEDPKALIESEKPTTPQRSQYPSGVWGNSWRSNPSSQSESKNASNYARATQGRGMKILRPGKSISNPNRTTSATFTPTNGMAGSENATSNPTEGSRRTSQAGLTPKSVDTPSSLPTKSNPIGQASAFGWLNSGQQKRGTATSTD